MYSGCVRHYATNSPLTVCLRVGVCASLSVCVRFSSKQGGDHTQAVSEGGRGTWFEEDKSRGRSETAGVFECHYDQVTEAAPTGIVVAAAFSQSSGVEGRELMKNITAGFSCPGQPVRFTAHSASLRCLFNSPTFSHISPYFRMTVVHRLTKVQQGEGDSKKLAGAQSPFSPVTMTTLVRINSNE